MKYCSDDIKWADWCRYCLPNFLGCAIKEKCDCECIGGYLVNQNCQFHEDVDKDLTNGAFCGIINIEEERNE